MNITTMNETAATAGKFDFLWGLVPLLLLGVLAVQLIRFYRSYVYRRVVKDFMAGCHEDLEARIEPLRKKLGPNRQGKMKKKNAEAYNNLCHILASLALLQGEDDAFLDRISEIEYEETYALRSFTLALYYLGKQQPEIALEHYCDFKACEQKDWSMGVVMDHLFEPEVEQGEEDLPDALDQFRNPATVYLLKKAGLLCEEEEEGEDEEEYEYEE